jgi:hypothetical protein
MRSIMIIVDRATGELSHFITSAVKVTGGLKQSIYLEEFGRSFPLDKIFGSVSLDNDKINDYLGDQRSYNPHLGFAGVYEIIDQDLFDKLNNIDSKKIEKPETEKSSNRVKPFLVLKGYEGKEFELRNWQEFDELIEAKKFLSDSEYESIAFFQQQNYWLYKHDSEGVAILYIRPEGRN